MVDFAFSEILMSSKSVSLRRTFKQRYLTALTRAKEVDHGKVRLLAQQFGKAVVSSSLATGCDFALTALLFSVYGGKVGWCTFLGAVAGGVVNCAINSRWTFRGSGQSARVIMARYVCVWGGSILLNTYGVVWGMRLATRWLSTRLDLLMLVKAVVAVVVYVLWNFNMQKHFVYRRRNHDEGRL